MKSLVVRLLVALASSNNGHNSNLRACYAGVRSSSKSSLVLVRPLRFRNIAWRSSFVANLSNIASRHVPTVGAGACTVAGHCHMAVMILACNLIWPYNNYVLSRALGPFRFRCPWPWNLKAQVELALLLFGCIGQGLHNLVDHLAYVLGHHHGPLGLLRRCNLGCDSRG